MRLAVSLLVVERYSHSLCHDVLLLMLNPGYVFLWADPEQRSKLLYNIDWWLVLTFFFLSFSSSGLCLGFSI